MTSAEAAKLGVFAAVAAASVAAPPVRPALNAVSDAAAESGVIPTHYNLEMTAWEMREWERRTDLDRPDDEAMADPLWRLCHLYQCQDENGVTVDYTPTPEQRLVLWCIYGRGWKRIIIPKARQLGMSLTLCLCEVDGLVFNEGFKAAWIDKTRPDTMKKMSGKIQFAFDRLPAEIRESVQVKVRSKLEFELQSWPIEGENESPVSGVYCDITFRGGTVEFLVVSEWGWIQAMDRARSVEINAGAMPAVERAANGVCVIETTWEGGLDGEVGPYVMEALTIPEEKKAPKSWRILFFGWHTSPLYRQSHGYVDRESAKYFEECEKLGLFLDHEQKLWYAEKRRTSTKVKKEYPSFVHECWEATPEGSIYGVNIEAARGAGRIVDFHHDARYPVHTFWDLGHPINTVCWMVQFTPREIRVLDVLMELDITLEDRAATMRAMGYSWGYHYFPWEADEDNTISIKQIDELRRVFGPNVRIVKKINRKWLAINYMRSIFGRFVFHATRCKKGIEHLGRYRSITETSSGIAKDEPVHDKYSHAADAFRQIGQAMESGMVPESGVVGAAVEQSAPVQPVKLAGRR